MNNVLVIGSSVPQTRKLFRMLELATEAKCIRKPEYNESLEHGYIYTEQNTFTIVSSHTDPVLRGQRYDEVINFSNILNVFMNKYLEGLRNV